MFHAHRSTRISSITLRAIATGFLLFSLRPSLGLAAGLASDPGHELPAHLCYAGCSAEQERINKEFETAGALAPNALPAVYSGACYHLSSDLEANDRHHAVALFDPHNGATHFTGEFSFYAPTNPYSSWTPEEAAQKLNPKHNEFSRVHLESDYAWLDYNPGKTPIWQYYLRQKSTTVYLVGFWGTKHLVFCELTPNGK